MTWNPTFRDRVLSGMAFLHSEFMGRKQSVSFKSSPGSSITYVYDTDVIWTFTIPWETGPDSADGWGYGQLLPRVEIAGAAKSPLEQRQFEDGNAWHTARILSERALGAQVEDNEVNSGIVMFDPHLSEIVWREKIIRDNSLDHTARASQFLGRDAFSEQTEKVLKHLLSSKAQPDEILRYASRRMEVSLLEHFDGRARDTRAAENFDILKQKFGPFEPFSEVASSFSKLKISKSFTEIESYARRVLSLFWTTRLAKQKPGRVRTRNFKNDVEVLVELAVVNRRLLEASVPHRVVFVTGDKNLVKSSYYVEHSELRKAIRSIVLEMATHANLGSTTHSKNHDMEMNLEKYFFNCSFDPESKYAAKDWMSNFSYHYVRHFWAVAGEALIETKDTKAFQDLFHGLFARRGNWVRASRRRVEELVLNGLDHKGNEEFDDFRPEDCLAKWNALSASRIRDARASEFGIDKNLAAEMDQSIDPTGKSARPQSIVSTLVEYSNRRRDRVMLALSDLGAIEVLRSLNIGGEYQDVYFVSLSNTRHLIKNLNIPNYYSSESVDKFLIDFEAIKGDCFGHDREDEYDDRQLSHLKFLVLAIIFASSDKWEAAFGHARRAQNVIDRSVDRIPVKEGSPSNMSGRESQFMLSICLRKRAETLADFDQASSCLVRAREALRADLKVNPDTDEEFHAARFLNEELAIKLGRYYFLRSLEPEANLDKFRDPVNIIYNHLKDARSIFEEVLARNIASGDMSKSNYPPLTVDFIALNVLQVFVISAFRKESILLDEGITNYNQLIVDALTWLNERQKMADHAEPVKTKIYRYVAGGLVRDDRFPTFRSRDHLERNFSKLLDLVGSNTSDLPEYELWRRKALRAFARSLI